MITTPEQMREAAIAACNEMVPHYVYRDDVITAIRAIPIAPQPDPVEHWRHEVGKLHSQVERLKHIVVTQGVEMERRLVMAENAEAALAAAQQPVAVTVKPSKPDRAEKNRRNTLTYDEQMREAEASCVPCKLCGGKAKIQDAGPGWGYYIGCENFGQRKNECYQQGTRTSGWAYNVADRWNELNAIHPADPLSDPRVVALVEAAAKAAEAIDMAYGAEDDADPHRHSSGLRTAIRAIDGEA